MFGCSFISSGFLSFLFFFFWSFGAKSHHPLQDIENADAVNGDKSGEVRRDMDPLQRCSRWIEGLQGLAFLHIPPLANRQRKKEWETSETLFKLGTLSLCIQEKEEGVIVHTISKLVLIATLNAKTGNGEMASQTSEMFKIPSADLADKTTYRLHICLCCTLIKRQKFCSQLHLN